MSSRRTISTVVAVVLSSIASACGGGQDTNQAASTSSTASGQPQAAAAAAAPSRCPLTAEQVSAAVGAPINGPDVACMFYPDDDPTVSPNVTFVRQVSFACSGTMPAEVGYKEQVPGLGVAAHIADDAEGMRILVCQGQTPFEITVNAATPAVERDAAIALARQVLAGS
jgi:hypothetical protein